MTASPQTLADWLQWIDARHPASGIRLGLDRVRQVAKGLDLAHPARQVITVAGTNGKGSTVAFIEAMARAAGLRVGTYTSPHLLRYNERIRIDGQPIDDPALAEAFAAVEAARPEPVQLTYFEYGTLAALWLFGRAGLDLAVLEVGLGGRLDAVNLVDADVAVVTTVDLDHQEWLGNDREAIGSEKVGIARAFRPLVLGDDDPPASVLRHAYAVGASALRIGCDFFCEPRDDAHWQWRDVGTCYRLPMPHLKAPVQLRNAAVAIAALRACALPVGEAACARGVAEADLPGRLQTVERSGITLYLDVGHNRQAAEALAAWLRQHPVPGRTLAVYAALADKDAPAVVQALGDAVQQWHVAGLQAGPRSQTADDLRQRLQDTAAASAQVHVDVASALQAVLQQAGPDDRVLVFGSFHTVAEAMAWLDAG